MFLLLRLAPLKNLRIAARASSTQTFLSGNAANYVDGMYEAWRKDPASVHTSWQVYFGNIQDGVHPADAFTLPPSLAQGVSPNADTMRQVIEDHLKVQLLVRAYQVRGHRLANLDPLGIVKQQNLDAPEFEPTYYGFSESDMQREFQLGAGVLPRFTQTVTRMKLVDIIATLRQIYCGRIGYDYIHIPDRIRCDWIRSRIEVPQPYAYDRETKKRILDRLMWADLFEKFVATKWPGEKRFGLEGCESLIPGLKALIDRSVDEGGVEHVVIGMPHRGRLNVLSNVIRKPNESIFCEFSGVMGEALTTSGDVKYHLGMTYERPTPQGHMVNLSLVANPSHLEAVDPVVIGKARALQFFSGNDGYSKVMPVLLHGDAAFAGQGVVYETLGMAGLPNYGVGGTIHLIVNNQIGFTTDPRMSRSTPYCSDIARTIDAPIIHVNGDDPEAVVFACTLAADWRMKFQSDVVVDIVCYRRHGHNEIDQPSFTQPRMYSAISRQPSTLSLYSGSLAREGCLEESEIERMRERVWSVLEECYAASKGYTPTAKEWMTSHWNGFKGPRELRDSISPARITGLPLERLREIGLRSASWPTDFDIHPGLKRILEARRQAIESGSDIDMPTAEALAFGSLLVEGNHVRLSGQVEFVWDC